MLSSTRDCLHALRTGNYLLFLDWPRRVSECYYEKNNTYPAPEELLHLLVFEWMDSDFCNDDIQLIALLYKLNEREPKPLASDLDYALTTISVVVVQWMFYKNNSSFDIKEKNFQNILRLMKKKSSEIDFESIELQRKQFLDCVDTIASTRVDALLSKIKIILDWCEIISAYIQELEKKNSIEDDSRLSRISLLKRLKDYLHEQSVITEEALEQKDAYLDKIWQLHPQKYEENYLLQLSSEPILKRVERTVTNFSVGFFQLLLDSQSATEMTSDQPNVDVKKANWV